MIDIVKEIIVPGGLGTAVSVKAGQYLTVTDLEGTQVASLMAFMEPDFKEYLSVSHSRYNQMAFRFKPGDVMLTNYQNPFIVIEEDTFRLHDTTFPCCDSAMYKRNSVDPEKHRSCRQNFVDTLMEYGIEEWRFPDTWNLFQDSPNMNLRVGKTSAPGDFIRLKFLKDALVALSACPYDLDGFNGGVPTPLKLTVSEDI